MEPCFLMQSGCRTNPPQLGGAPSSVGLCHGNIPKQYTVVGFGSDTFLGKTIASGQLKYNSNSVMSVCAIPRSETEIGAGTSTQVNKHFQSV